VLIVPTVEFPPATLSTLQVAPLSDAVNCCDWVTVTMAARAGETVTCPDAHDEAKKRTQLAIGTDQTPKLLRIPAP
jgi:hypothetical protein